MFSRLTEYTRRFAYHPHALGWLFFYSVIESVFFPISPEVMLIPMTAARPQRALTFATIGMTGSVIGGMIGYSIGMWAFEPIAVPFLNWSCTHFSGMCPEVAIPKLEGLFQHYGLWLVGIAAMSPVIPYRFTILVAGLGHMPFTGFVIISIIAHWIRYALICWIVAKYGAIAMDFVRRRLPHIFITIGVIALVVFMAIAYF